MKKMIIGLLLFAQQSNVPQPEPLTVEKIAEKFVQDHAAETARCLVLRIQYEQINDQNTKLISENAVLRKQIMELTKDVKK